MDTISFWNAISKRDAEYPQLNEDLEVDVVIIGGGITGVTSAFQLIESGKTVALLEASRIGGVTTAASTGNLYIPVQPFYQSIYSKFNLDVAKTIGLSRKLAIDYIENNVQDLKINCEFHRRPWYAYTNRDARISLDKEVEIFKKMDLQIDYTTDLPLPLKFKKAIIMPDQARFNPLKYVIALADRLVTKGCHIFENSRVTSIDEKNICTVHVNNAKIKAKKVLIATHTPIGINPTQMFTAPYRSYVVAVRLKDKNYPEGHFWDLDRPPHATCTHAIHGKKPELLMVAGSHHKTGQGPDTHLHYKELTKFLTDHFPVEEIAYQWSAQHFQSADDVPYIGLASRSAKNVYMATGFFADGLVYGTVAGIMMGNLLAGKKSDLLATYQSNRITPMASSAFLLKEDSNVFFQYLKDMPFMSDNDYTNLKNGEGKIVEINQEKCAASRDEKGKMHIVSGVCTHMKCIVNWNSAEKSWDCPCHGSRFTPQGEVIEGPATVNLKDKTPVK